MLKAVLIVGLGGALGTMCRYVLSVVWKQGTFPFTTLLINVMGSLVIGIVFALNEKNNFISNDMKLFLATGICGGFTTFSTFSVENVMLLKAGNYWMAMCYILTSIVACLLATFIGFKIINN